MRIRTSEFLADHSPRILDSWESRAKSELYQAENQTSLALRDSLPQYLKTLADELSPAIDRTRARLRADHQRSLEIGREHGRGRAELANYPIDQLVSEYHILRQVICEVLETERPLLADEREIIVSSIEQAVNDASSEFSEALLEYQRELTHDLAHDIRGPLTSAKMSSQFILRNYDHSDDVKQAAQLILDNVEYLDSMIRNLLDAGKLRAPRH